MNSLQELELNTWNGSGEDQEELKQRFEITGMDSLNWAFRKLSAFKAKEADITKLAQAERDRIDYWEADQKKSIQENVEFFESLIYQYHAKILHEDPKAKTLSTPYGKSKSRKTKATPDKADEKAILKHVIDNQMDAYIKPSLKWADLKKSLKIVDLNGQQCAVDENGQIVPGVVVKPESISYTLEVE